MIIQQWLNTGSGDSCVLWMLAFRLAAFPHQKPGNPRKQSPKLCLLGRAEPNHSGPSNTERGAAVLKSRHWRKDGGLKNWPHPLHRRAFDEWLLTDGGSLEAIQRLKSRIIAVGGRSIW